MITDTDIKKLRGVFATKDDIKGFATEGSLKKFASKDDLKRFATKDDLKRFATKDDLKRFATKDDLKRFATKTDLKKFATKDDFKSLEKRVDTLAEYVVSHDGKLEEITTKLDEMGDIRGMFEKIMTMLESSVKRQEKFTSEQAAVHHRLDRHRTHINHIATVVDTTLPA